MGWGNIYLRRARVFAVALVVYFDYKTLQQREKLTRKSKRSGLWERAHERNAKRVLNLIVELEGLWVKLGQYLSTRADVLPEAYVRLLRQLQDSLPPRPFREVSRTIEKELRKPIDEVFADIHEDALATASIAQVHQATLVNGQKVVVKVQHEGIKAVILEDLKNAKSIVDWIAWAEPQYDFNPMIDEWCKEAPKELDFNHEAENTRTVAKNLGCRTASDENVNPNRVDVLIPEVIQSTEKLLILEYMDGIRLSDLQSLAVRGVDNQKIVEEITRAYAHQIYIDGFFNGDPHPGNFLVSREVPHRPILLDFGLTKKLSTSFKQALAKMFLASVEGDQVALLSAFSEMGLKLRLDMPEQAMDVINVLFRATTSAKESIETAKQLNEQRNKNMKIIQEKMNMSEKDVKRFNPIDAFPGDIVIFTRVLNLLRGLSSSMNVRIVYLDIMKPFAVSALQGSIAIGPKFTDNWIFDTPVHSDVETKLRQLLVELGNKDKILGVQVCAYKDGKVIIDTAAGMLGKYDPRPVQPDSLFPVFSVTKGITAGMLHWLVDNGKLKLDENVANIWPEFKSNRKDHVKVHHILNHTSGLHNAMGNVIRENPAMLTDWNECLKCIAKSVPETEPGEKQLYHYLSFGWLCGGIIENASGKKFQEILEEAFVQPLQIEGELYIGIPPGVESRLAALTVDLDDLTKLSSMRARPNMPDDFQPRNMAGMVSTLPVIFNMLNTRRAIIPAANGHCSARALARFYAALVDSGTVPPPHSSSSKPALGSHPHVRKFPSLNLKPVKKLKSGKNKDLAPDPAVPDSLRCGDSSMDSSSRLVGGDSTGESISLTSTHQFVGGKLFGNPRIHDAFLGIGEYESFVMPEGEFGLGFKRYPSKDRSSFIGFGHSGIGGSTGFCDLESKFAIAVTLNKMSFGAVTARIVHFVCSELNIPVPEDYLRILEIESNVGHTNLGGGPIIN